MRQLWILAFAAFASVGCNPRPLFLQPRPTRDWPATLQSAKEAARQGRHAEADSILAAFASRHAESYEAREARYWRALVLIDPANTQASTAAALRSINEYFANGATADAYDEATILRRVVQRADSLAREMTQARQLIAEAREAAAEPGAQPAPAERRETRVTRNLVGEVRRLRDELPLPASLPATPRGTAPSSARTARRGDAASLPVRGA
jgi:hypothetical protein